MTLALHLTRAVAYRILAALLLLGGLAMALDLVESASDILKRDDGGLLRYFGLRAPMIVSAVAPVALIVGPVLAFLSLSSRNEFTILRAAGATTYRMLLLLTPLALVLGLALFALNDRIVPAMEGRLLNWLEDDPVGSTGDFWARTTNGVIHADASSPRGDLIVGATIYETDVSGRLLSRISTTAARFRDGEWRFQAASRLIPGRGASEKIDGAVWDTPLRPANVRSLATPGRSVAGDVASRILSGVWAGNRTGAFYQVRVYRGYAALAAPFVMILLAAPAAYGARRSGGGGKRAAFAVALGFAFLLVDGMLTALGETGVLPPLLGAFGASAMFAAIGAYALITLEE